MHHQKRGYLSFDHNTRAGRNSKFAGLSDEQRIEIGQLELKAMTLLAVVMAAYILTSQVLMVVIWAPYFSAGHYTYPDFSNGFETSRTWFSVFQVESNFSRHHESDDIINLLGVLHVQ
jgi:hypothetical protein